MVLRNITERCRSRIFTRAVTIASALFLSILLYGEGNKGYAQFNFLRTNNPAPAPNRPSASNHPPANHLSAQNRTASQNRSVAQQRQNAQNTQRNEPQTLPQGNRNAQLLEATNSQAAMKTALEAIPWNRLSNPAKEKIQSVLSNKPLYRRLPQQSAYCEPVMYDFLLNHPDVVVAIWENLGVTQISLKEHGRPGVYQLRETVGSAGIIEVLYKTRNYCIAYSKGSYTAPFLPKPVVGETILILQSDFEQDEEGDPYVVTQLDAFVKVNNFGVEMFAKMLAPMLGRIADSNFEETIAFLGNVSEAAQANPEVIRRLALRLESIRKEVRDEFIQVAYHTAQLAINRSGEGLDSPYGRHLTGRQASQTSQQHQEFNQERLQYLQNLQRIQQLQQQQQDQKQRSNLPSALVMRQEMAQATAAPANKPPTGSLVKPQSMEKNGFTIDAMSPDNDFSRSLEMFDKMIPAPSKPVPILMPQPAQNATPLNLDLDLDLSLSKSAPATATSDAPKNPNEQTVPALDLNLETANQDTIPKTPKVVTVPPQSQKVPASNTPPPSPATATGKSGGAVFATPTISR